MTKFLIVNADDFGLCKEIQDGIIKSFSDGIVTSTSVVVNGRAFKDGIQFLKDSGIDVGIHLTFTGGEKPIVGIIQGLVDDRGYFLKSYKSVIQRILLGNVDYIALENELSAQIKILLDNGIFISHIDSHQHLHMLPYVRDIIIKLAKHFKIKWIRTPYVNKPRITMAVMNMLSYSLKKRLKKQGIKHTDMFKGFEYGGNINEAILSFLLCNIKHGITELMVHPGYDASLSYNWGYNWEDELLALTSDTIKELIRKNDIVLTNFRRSNE